MTHEQPTNQDILEAVNNFATNVETRFQSLEESVGGVKTRLSGTENKLGGLENKLNGIKNTISSLETRVGGLENNMIGIQNKMVTKDYLDDKLYDLRGDLISLTRKEDEKLGTLVQILKKRKVINPSEAKQILELEPFAR